MTANPTIFAKAIEGSDSYDEPFAALVSDGCSVNDAYWHLVIDDVRHALALLRPTFDASVGTDGFVSSKSRRSWPATPAAPSPPPATSTCGSTSPTCS